MLEELLQEQLLKSAVGSVMFCPDCKRCLDWTNAMLVMVNDTDGETLGTFCGCGMCADRFVASCKRKKEFKKLTIDKTDGRFLSHPRLDFGEVFGVLAVA